MIRYSFLERRFDLPLFGPEDRVISTTCVNIIVYVRVTDKLGSYARPAFF